MSTEDKKLSQATDNLEKTVTVKIDRPIHSRHPKFNWEYQLNYGFVPDTLAKDGDELDAYVIGIDQPVETFTGVCIAIIHRMNDDDDKLVVVPEDKKGISDDEIRAATHFQEKFFRSIIVRVV